MSIRIFFTNGNGAGPAIPHEIADGTTAVAFFLSLFQADNARNFSITVNGFAVAAGHILRDGDHVIIARITGAAREVAQGAPAPAPAPVRNISIDFLNARDNGFAQVREVREGTTYEQFLSGLNIQARTSIVRIRNRGFTTAFNPTAGYVLRAGDLVSVTPSNISGARR